MKSTMLIYIAAASLLLLSGGCVKEYTMEDVDDTTITLKLSLPYAGNGATRSIASEPDATGENRVNTIDLLALTMRNGDWVYDYTAEIVSRVQNGKELTITARVRGLSSPQQFVILANASSELAAAAPVRYDKMSDIEQRLVCSTGGGEWPANNNGAGLFIPFPMYARTGALTVNPDTPIGTYQMIRMVARINVTLKSGLDNFLLEEACLFNYKTAGYVSYGKSGFAGTKATTPAVPPSGDHAGVPVVGPTVFYRSDKTADPRGTILSSIYTFESPAIVAESERTRKTALVIGGYYNGETVNKSYYRIDFKTEGDPTADISGGLLRNHSYEIEIQAVTGSGYDKPEDAYLGEGSKLSAVVMPWNLATQSVIGDGQYWLKISDDVLTVSGEGGSVDFTAQTNYDIFSQGFPAGLQINEADISYTSGSGWLSVSGGGNGDLYRAVTVTASRNPSGERMAKMMVKAGNLTKYITIIQPEGLPEIPEIPESGAPVSLATYVGAFWRAGQTGERLIRIHVPSSDAAGKWAVQVYDYGDFEEGDIVFSTDMSADFNIGWRTDVTPNQSMVADMNDGFNDYYYRVDGDERSVKGTVAAGDYFFFRVGLKSTWTPTPAKPARYGVIVLSYNNNTKFQKIWLRQGEDEDYLIHPDDVLADEKNSTKKYIPYNLTAPHMTENDYTDVGVRCGAWTKYPSQAGAFFQWAASPTHVRRAWHPGKINVSGWDSGFNDAATWESISHIHETCPVGYRRPIINADGSLSEVARSLLVYMYNPELRNAVWGYYADGFFDRRMIDPVSLPSTVADTAVEKGNSTVAYAGVLFFNNIKGSVRSHASIFFPAAGHRFAGSGELKKAGGEGFYWSQVPLGSGEGTINTYYDAYHWAFYYDSVNTVGMSNRGLGFTIRCVKE